MRIEQDVKLDFCDVLLKPKRSTIESRKDVDLTRTFKFRWSQYQWTGIPIISSNMTSVTTPEVARKMVAHGMLACMPKTYHGDIGWTDNIIQSVGMTEKPSPNNRWICLDVPNAYLDMVVERTKELRKMCPDSILIAGNVVTKKATKRLLDAGADIVKCGLGSGSGCRTRIATGVGYPQLSAVIECAKEARKSGGLIISDGGCVVPGDLAKAFVGGAGFVMLGGMLAGHNENAELCECKGRYKLSGSGLNNCTKCDGTGKINSFYGMSSERANREFAGGLRTYRASEGWEIQLLSKGSLESTLQDILGGLRSACSYVGAKSIQEFPTKTTFIQVNRQANMSLWEHRV